VTGGQGYEGNSERSSIMKNSEMRHLRVGRELQGYDESATPRVFSREQTDYIRKRIFLERDSRQIGDFILIQTDRNLEVAV